VKTIQCREPNRAERRKRVAERQGRRPKLTSDEAADYVGLGRSTLPKYRVFGGGPPYFKLSRRVIYDADDLDAWMEARRRSSTSDVGEDRANPKTKRAKHR
jgi:predicted DNA-binding transcriptional regulator AlpA